MDWIVDNWDTIAIVLGAIVAIVRQTAWGRANQRALDLVTRAVEQRNAVAVKATVRGVEPTLPASASKALRKAVAKASVKPKH